MKAYDITKITAAPKSDNVQSLLYLVVLVPMGVATESTTILKLI